LRASRDLQELLALRALLAQTVFRGLLVPRALRASPGLQALLALRALPAQTAFRDLPVLKVHPDRPI
jgi:hypothetical protein